MEEEVRENAFHDNGEYKGCYLDEDILLKLQYSHIEDDEVYERLVKLDNYWKNKGLISMWIPLTKWQKNRWKYYFKNLPPALRLKLVERFF